MSDEDVVDSKEISESTTPDDSPTTSVDIPDGGLKAWITVVGCWLTTFAAMGYASSFGVFQPYYTEVKYPDHTASEVSWIGSLQVFLQFGLGLASGPLYDRGYFYWLVGGGAVMFSISVFTTALCDAYWQTFLCNGLGLGIGTGCMCWPTVSLVSQYFLKRRSLAIGIVTSGSAAGGIAIPILLNNLLQRHSFKIAVVWTSTMVVGCLLCGICLMRVRIRPIRAAPRPSIPSLFRSIPYRFNVGGQFLITWGVLFPFFYIQAYAKASNMPDNITLYLIAIVNAASIVGRITSNLAADYVGPVNAMVVTSAITSGVSFAMIGATTPATLIVVSLLIGSFTGSFFSLNGPALIACAADDSEIGARVGVGVAISGITALTGNPIAGALMTHFGYVAAISFAGAAIIAGSGMYAVGGWLLRPSKGSWRV